MSGSVLMTNSVDASNNSSLSINPENIIQNIIILNSKIMIVLQY